MFISVVHLLLAVHAFAHQPNSQIVTNTSKAGLGWSNGPSVDITQFTSTGKVSWYYTWYPIGLDNALEFVPMLWGTQQIDVFMSSINHTLSSGNIIAVLGMNEPQEPGQSNLTPQQGADMWKTYLEPLHARGIRLGSPATSSSPTGLIWIQDFFSACAGGCTVDFIALHWYDINATAFQLYVENFYNTFQKPIWVTEWACQNYNNASAQCTQEEVVLFLNQTQSFMDNTSWVERYAWFGAMKILGGVNHFNALMDENGRINDLGEQYIGARYPGFTGVNGSIRTNMWVSPIGLSWLFIWFAVSLFMIL